MANIESLNIIFKDEQGTDLNKYGITEDTGLEKQVKLRRLANITQKGTPLNAQNLNSLKDKINEVVNKANTNETEISNALTNAKAYTDKLETKVSQTYETKTDATSKLESAKSYSDTNKQNAITSANTYTDQKVKKAIEDLNTSGDTNLGLAKAYTDQKVSDGVKQAKTYTDTQIGKINSDLVLKVECDHAVEITGQTNHEYNLAIPDESSVVITKIQGHSRRKSLNEWKLKPGTHQNLTVTYNEDGSYTFNGQGGVSVPLERQMIIGETYSFVLEKISGEITGTSINEFIQCGQQWFSENVSYRKYDGSGKTAWFNVHSVFNNLKVKLNVIKGTYNNETMPMFQPYDNTFVNSNNTLISTGRNLNKASFIQGKINIGTGVYESDNTSICSSDFVLYPIPNQEITVELSTGYGADTWFFEYDENKKMVQAGAWSLAGARTFTPSNKCKYFKLSVKNNNISTLASVYFGAKKDGMLEPYKQDIIQAPSLGEFDYILPQSNQRVRQTSQMVTLNGSENWIIEEIAPTKRFLLQRPGQNGFDDANSANTINNAGLQNASANHTWSTKGTSMSLNGNHVHLLIEGITTLDALKQYLRSNPIQLVYKLATPTYETVSVPSGYKVSNGGMQLQVGDVPYTLYKEYAVSLRAQVENNAQINVQQQGQINELESKTNNVYNKSEVDTKVEEINTNLKKINTSLNNKQDTLNRDSNVEVYSIKATTLNGKLISNLGNSTNYYTYHCSVNTSDGKLYFKFITNTKSAPKNEEQWQYLNVFSGSGAISNTGSNINSYYFSILKQGVWFMWLRPTQSNVSQSFQPKFFKCTDVTITYIEDMFGNRYNTEGQLIS